MFWAGDRRIRHDKTRYYTSRESLPGFTCKQDSMVNEIDYVELGLACADVCKALDRGMKGRRADELSQSVNEVIAQLTT